MTITLEKMIHSNDVKNLSIVKVTEPQYTKNRVTIMFIYSVDVDEHVVAKALSDALGCGVTVSSYEGVDDSKTVVVIDGPWNNFKKLIKRMVKKI